MRNIVHYLPNNDGWNLAVRQTFAPESLDRSLRPVLIIPGYGMNSFIFGYHPTGQSMTEYLASEGLEVWTVDLRGQGASIPTGRTPKYGLKELALVDVATTIDYISSITQATQRRVDAVGCSLGGTLLYIYAALKKSPDLGAIVAMGSPLRWVAINPVFRMAFRSPQVAGLFRVKFSRTLARYGLPVLKVIPWLLSIYLHPEIVDLSRPELLAKTVEDPVPQINKEIAEWINAQDLTVNGFNVTESFQGVENPLLCVVANADGIVPRATSEYPLELAGSKVKEILAVGDDRIRMAHADMFISEYAQELVFQPLASWLKRHQALA